MNIAFWTGREPSLFRRLLLGFTAVTLVAWLCVVGWTIREVKGGQMGFAQAQLKTAARQALVTLRPYAGKPDLIRHAAEETEGLQVELYGAMNVLLSPYQLQVWQHHGLAYASRDLPLSEPLPSDFGRLSRLRMSGKEGFSWTEMDARSGLVVRVAQESLFGFAMGWTSLGFYVLPLLVSLPFLLLPALLVVRRGLQPLNSIVSEIEQRTASNLSPLVGSTYQELKPLTTSVNRLMERLSDRMEREQEFLQDAAHELKTPLAIVQINADSLRDAQDEPRRQQAGNGLALGIARATHTVHQLLTLARTGADGEMKALHPSDLAQLVRERLGLAAQLALERGIEIELEAPDACMLGLHRESATALIDNIIDNAVKYSPNHGRIKVCVLASGGTIQLTVSDEGMGIPPELRAKVFERFFRRPGLDQTGSGLGLAIVERAAKRNQAQVRLSDGPGGVGLLVIVDFSVRGRCGMN